MIRFRVGELKDRRPFELLERERKLRESLKVAVGRVHPSVWFRVYEHGNVRRGIDVGISE